MSLVLTSKLKAFNNVVEITINNPKAKNALSDNVITDLLNALSDADKDETIDFIILKGANQCFSAGGDIKMMRAKEGMFSGSPNQLRKNYQNQIQEIPQLIEKMETILIASIEGPAIGAGLDLACMCDFRIASKSAYFAESFVKIGLIPGIGGSFFLMRLIGYAKAMELTLTGRKFDASEALQIGMLNQVVEDNKLEETVYSLIEQLNKNSKMAMQMAKKSIKYAYQNDYRVILDLLSSYQGICQTDEDHLNRLGK